MENETPEEVIVDSQETNEAEAEVETPAEATPEKPKETPEAKKSRLTRQLKQVNKELGVEEEVKPKAKKKEETTSDGEFGLLELTFLKGEDIKSEDEIDFVKKELKEAGLDTADLPKLFANKYFKSELESFRTDAANTLATSDVKGGGGESKATDSPAHWIAKGLPPTAEQVPDKDKRVAIHRAMMKNAESSGKMFYND